MSPLLYAYLERSYPNSTLQTISSQGDVSVIPLQQVEPKDTEKSITVEGPGITYYFVPATDVESQADESSTGRLEQVQAIMQEARKCILFQDNVNQLLFADTSDSNAITGHVWSIINILQENSLDLFVKIAEVLKKVRVIDRKLPIDFSLFCLAGVAQIVVQSELEGLLENTLHEMCHDEEAWQLLPNLIQDDTIHLAKGQETLHLPYTRLLAGLLPQVAQAKQDANATQAVFNQVKGIGKLLYWSADSVDYYGYIGEEIGRGVSKRVRRIVPLLSSNQTYALMTPVNKVHTQGYVNALFKKEAQIAQDLYDCGVPAILPVKPFTYKGKVKLISTYCNDGHLSGYIQKRPLAQLGVYMIGRLIAQVVYMMHARGSICHGDLKLSNILVADSGEQADNKELFLCDFCSSGTLGEEFPFLHTSYPAPELMDTSCKIYTPSIDLWCLGILLFRLKYDSEGQRQMVRKYFSHAALKHNQTIYQEGIRRVHEVCKKSMEIGKGNAEYIRGYDQAIIELLSVDPRNRPPAHVIWHMLDKDNPNYDQKSA